MSAVKKSRKIPAKIPVILILVMASCLLVFMFVNPPEYENSVNSSHTENSSDAAPYTNKQPDTTAKDDKRDPRDDQETDRPISTNTSSYYDSKEYK
jgi:hypothetical protein